MTQELRGTKESKAGASGGERGGVDGRDSRREPVTDSLIARMNSKRAIVEIFLAICAVVGLVFLVRGYSPDIPKQLELHGRSIALEIADSAYERKRGLSGRDHLDSYTGLLFVFRTEDYYPFWMPDMYFPIDIIWMDRDFFVVDIETNVSPDSYPKIFQPSKEAQYVLELNAGEAQELRIKEGSVLMPIF